MGDTHPGWGYRPWMGDLPWMGGYLPWMEIGTYLGHGVPTLDRGVPTMDKGYLPRMSQVPYLPRGGEGWDRSVPTSQVKNSKFAWCWQRHAVLQLFHARKLLPHWKCLNSVINIITKDIINKQHLCVTLNCFFVFHSIVNTEICLA